MISTRTLGRMRLAAAGSLVTAAVAGAGVAIAGDEVSASDAPSSPEPVPPAAVPAPERVVDPAFDPDDCLGCGLG